MIKQIWLDSLLQEGCVCQSGLNWIELVRSGMESISKKGEIHQGIVLIQIPFQNVTNGQTIGTTDNAKSTVTL